MFNLGVPLVLWGFKVTGRQLIGELGLRGECYTTINKCIRLRQARFGKHCKHHTSDQYKTWSFSALRMEALIPLSR